MSHENTVYTIGHSNHSAEHFLELLNRYMVSAVADVRSTPYSRYCPHFNRTELVSQLCACSIRYVYLGQELGGRSDDPNYYKDGHVQYRLLARRPEFLRGIDRLKQGMKTFRVVLMCSEAEPLECHRALLVSRYLKKLGIKVTHIHSNHSLETHSDAEERLLNMHDLKHQGFWTGTWEERLEEAYLRQEKRFAHSYRAFEGDLQEIDL